ncbi:uncharacterized protein Dvar_53510 [Desulfosarcina variabilis str. Montpellier]|uniref:hypothetical protein n=1 Tax=Desulfosarcina variabilis TaxID=2300 RepID=UPI003AFA08BA
MKIKVLFLDDIFSDLLRDKVDPEQLIFDDTWSESLENELLHKKISGIDFEVVKSGDIDNWQQLIEKEKPDVVLLDVYWHEHARKKWGDVRRAADISLDALKQIRDAYNTLPIIQYTLKPDKELMDQSYAAGATFFLEKVPLAIAEVHCALKYIMIYLLRENQ